MAKGLSPELLGWLDAAEKRNGLPTGLMHSLMMQESGGQARFAIDPGAYHYAPDEAGKRKSSARGLFGILESTASKPGYGVAPLKDWSPEAQANFAADYVGARIKHAGSVEAGLAGYGEGVPYAQQVMSRLGARPQVARVTPVAEPEVLAASLPAPSIQAAPPSTPVMVGYVAPQTARADVPQEDIAPPSIGFNVKVPQYPMQELSALMNNHVVPNFKSFGKWGAKA